MNEVQKRVLVMCEIHFYEATVGSSQFQVLLQSLGWKTQPDYSKAGLASLTRLAGGLRTRLRSTAI